jgi:hypothetical protein
VQAATVVSSISGYGEVVSSLTEAESC